MKICALQHQKNQTLHVRRHVTAPLVTSRLDCCDALTVNVTKPLQMIQQ